LAEKNLNYTCSPWSEEIRDRLEVIREQLVVILAATQ
jgi:hypothetical protein